MTNGQKTPPKKKNSVDILISIKQWLCQVSVRWFSDISGHNAGRLRCRQTVMFNCVVQKVCGHMVVWVVVDLYIC